MKELKFNRTGNFNLLVPRAKFAWLVKNRTGVVDHKGAQFVIYKTYKDQWQIRKRRCPDVRHVILDDNKEIAIDWIEQNC